MIKITGTLLMLTAFLIIGLKKRYALIGRLSILRASEAAAMTAYSRLKCMCMPLDECFSGSGGLFSDAADRMTDGEMPREAMHNAAIANRFLKSCDKAVFSDFADGLTLSDCAGQLSNLEMLRERLRPLTAEAADDAARLGKLCVEGFFLAGAAFALILI